MKEILLKYARYNQWANAKLVSTIETSAANLLDKEIASSFNTIRKTFLHMADAEYIWIIRLTNGVADKIPGQTGAGIDAVARLDQQLIDFIASKDESYFTRETAYKNLKGEAFTNNNFSILWHVFNHSTFHRGQIVTMLRNGGFTSEIGSTDFITFERIYKNAEA